MKSWKKDTRRKKEHIGVVLGTFRLDPRSREVADDMVYRGHIIRWNPLRRRAYTQDVSPPPGFNLSTS